MQWPGKHNLFGVQVSATTHEEAGELIIRAAQTRTPAIMTHMPVHGLILASRDKTLKERMNQFDIVAPDGHPVRWALNHFYRQSLHHRVDGPGHMLKLCRLAEESGVAIYLYGSHPHVIEALKPNLTQKFPSLRIAGAESPPFRALTPDEDRAVIERINKSGAGILFLGLGCPLQDNFAYEHRDKINAVQVCVGAAFDFHAGNKRMAPDWIREHGLEWAFRMLQEPRRLVRRYVETNSIFLYLVARAMLTGKLN